ncbi:MAG: hypothetical protein ACLFN5_05170 [bacterium]
MNDSEEDFIAFCARRFGVDKRFWGPYFIKLKGRSVYLETRGLQLAPDWSSDGRGFRIARLTTKSFKPGNRFLQWLGGRINKNYVELDMADLKALLNRQTVVSKQKPQSRGYVALVYLDIVIGCGFWSGEDLHTQISKALSGEFPRQILNRGDQIG